jgi:hypothetical protein
MLEVRHTELTLSGTMLLSPIYRAHLIHIGRNYFLDVQVSGVEALDTGTANKGDRIQIDLMGAILRSKIEMAVCQSSSHAFWASTAGSRARRRRQRGISELI